MGKRDTETIEIGGGRFIYRCAHLTMESTCAVDHGPRVVEIGPMRVDRYPVTNADYATFVTETGYAPPEPESFLRHWQDGGVPAARVDAPVVWVSPHDAAAYARWAGGRLPTDEEWQFIAAGPELRRWPWGSELDAGRCNHDGSGLCGVADHPDGASWCGCRDLSGNAWEWTDPIVDDGMHRFALIRGGSYYYAPGVWHVGGGARPTDYHWKVQLMNPRINRAATVGFRCVYEVTP